MQVGLKAAREDGVVLNSDEEVVCVAEKGKSGLQDSQHLRHVELVVLEIGSQIHVYIGFILSPSSLLQLRSNEVWSILIAAVLVLKVFNLFVDHLIFNCLSVAWGNFVQHQSFRILITPHRLSGAV